MRAAERLAGELASRYHEDRAAIGREIHRATANRASALGHPCARYGTYLRVAWDSEEPKGPGFGYAVREGTIAEHAFIGELNRLGFAWHEGQMPYSWPEYEITGHIEGRIADLRAPEEFSSPLLCELKALNVYTAAKIKTLRDLLSEWWTARYVVQIGLYMLMAEVEEAVLLVKNRGTGHLTSIPLFLWGEDEDSKVLRQETERALDRAVEINAAVHAWEDAKGAGATEDVLDAVLPDRMPYDGRICGSCGFRAICHPAQNFGSGVGVLEDPSKELQALLLEKTEAEEGKRRHDRAYREIKKRLDGLPDGTYLIGDWMIETGSRTKIERLPSEEGEAK